MKHNVALIILYDSEKKLLLQHRTKDATRLPDYWAFFGGEIEDGETPEEAIRREALEELNYEAVSPKLVIEQDFTLPNVEGHMFVYVDAFYEDKSILKLSEGQSWGWFKEDELDSLKMMDHDREVIRKLMYYLQNNLST